MSPDQFKQLEASITAQIKSVVNGKIDRLQAMVEKSDIKLDTYIREDNEWKADVKPYIENVRVLCNFSTVGSTLLKTIIVIGGAVGVIWGFIKYLK
jgi:fructose-1,6-bisphosphatase/inositol monophosphatase family enzyme